MNKDIIYIDCEPEPCTQVKNNDNKINKINKDDNSKRKLTEEEKESICDFLSIDSSLDFDISANIINNIKNDIMDQLKDIEIYPSLLNELKEQIIKYYYKSQIQPGQMVGVDSATSLGETIFLKLTRF